MTHLDILPPLEKGEDSDGPGPRSCDNRILYQKPAPYIPVLRTEPYGPSGKKQDAPIEGDFIGARHSSPYVIQD